MRRETFLIAGILLVSAALMTLLFQVEFSGPDQISYGTFARAGQQWSYWLKPSAFEENFFPMGYPSILAITMRASGGATGLYQVISITMGLSVSLLTWVLVYPLGLATRLLTMAATAWGPAVLWMSQSNGYEMLLCFLITSALVLVGSPSPRRSVLWATLAGVLLSAAALTNGVALSLLPLFVYLIWRRNKWGGRCGPSWGPLRPRWHSGP